VFRFRSEFESSRKSWIAVLVAYAFGALILLALAQFLIIFEGFAEEANRTDALAQTNVAATQLLRDLDSASSREAEGRAIARFEQRLAAAEAAAEGSARGDGMVAELVTSYRQGATKAALVPLAEQLAEEWASEAEGARSRAERSNLAVKFGAGLLGAIVIACVFAGGWLFLRRSRHLEQLLSQRAIELEEVDSSRRLFFATASHELRTPVTAIRGEAEVALADADDLDTVRQALRHIIAHSKFLNHRIEEMIGIARTSDGKLHLHKSRLDLCDIVAGAVQDARAFADSVEVALDLTMPDAEVPVVGDATWLKRAVLAVIENALKFSPMGGRVAIALTERDGIGEVTITDQGPGVVPEELPLVFDAYYQTDAGKARGGSGLGLAMTRWVAEQHGGRAGARNIGSWHRPNGCAVTVAVKLDRAA
jgi:signal transduction histidine kinase